MSSNSLWGGRGFAPAHPAATNTITSTLSRRADRMTGWYQAPPNAPKRFLACVVMIASFLPGCVSRDVPPIGLAGRPFTPEADERRIWTEAEKEEAKIQKAAKLYDDPLLEEYVARIGDRLTPADVRKAGGPGFEFHVLRDPTLNAFAMPNGKIYVHTGLLARAADEAQVAMILGHEMTHVTNPPALR